MTLHKVLMATAITVLCAQASKAQMADYTRTINGTGFSATIGTDVYEWSVGEMPLVQTFASSSLIVTQGVLQSDPVNQGVNEIAGITSNLHVFPVPTASLLHLQYDFDKNGTLSYELQDVAGRKIAGRSLTVSSGSQTEEVPMQSLANGHYLLRVMYQPNGAEKIATAVFKIEKN